MLISVRLFCQSGRRHHNGLRRKLGRLCRLYVSLVGHFLVSGRRLLTAFYEYLIKAYVYDSNIYGFYLERWLVAADSTITAIGSHPYGQPDLTLLPTWEGRLLDNSMESLSWFAGGNFILGGMVTNNQTLVDYGLSIADTAGAVYHMTATGLGAEFVTWTTSCQDSSRANACNPKNAIKITDSRFRLRPEVLETWVS